MSQQSVTQARTAFRSQHIPENYSGPRHLATTVTVSLAVAVLCGLMLEAVRPLEWLTIPLTFLYANLSEYLGHRGPMHRKTRFLGAVFERHTVWHHSFFTDEAPSYDSSPDFKAVLFPPILLVFFIGFFAVPVGAILYFLISPNVCFLFVLTAVLYFLNYELLHFAYHMDPQSVIGRLPLVGKLRRHHLRHHRRSLMTSCNFNITYPICDYLFGTLHRSGEQASEIFGAGKQE
jgi:sterol desaturase/sphingolipid hydroxylase (fatty acid hydroxylase superfamily)